MKTIQETTEQDRMELQMQFEKATGIKVINSQGEFDIDYVSWLESKLSAPQPQQSKEIELPSDEERVRMSNLKAIEFIKKHILNEDEQGMDDENIMIKYEDEWNIYMDSFRDSYKWMREEIRKQLK